MLVSIQMTCAQSMCHAEEHFFFNLRGHSEMDKLGPSLQQPLWYLACGQARAVCTAACHIWPLDCARFKSQAYCPTKGLCILERQTQFCGGHDGHAAAWPHTGSPSSAPPPPLAVQADREPAVVGLVTVVQAAAPSGFAILPRQPSGTYFPRWVELITLVFGDWDGLMRHPVRFTKNSWQPGCMLPHERCGWMPKLITPRVGHHSGSSADSSANQVVPQTDP